MDFDKDKEEAAEATATLPDGKTVKVPGKVRVEVPEMLMHPLLAEVDCTSLPDAIWGAVQKCDVDCRADLCKSILLSGGNTMLKGFQERLKSEIVKLAPADAVITITAGQDR